MEISQHYHSRFNAWGNPSVIIPEFPDDESGNSDTRISPGSKNDSDDALEIPRVGNFMLEVWIANYLNDSNRVHLKCV